MVTEEAHWQKRCRAVAAKINFATWLSTFLPLYLIVALVWAAGFVAARALNFSLSWVTLGGGIALLAAAGIAWSQARKKFWSEADAAVRLEAENSLHNRLTASRQGVTPWPAETAAPDGLAWNRRKVLPPFIFTLAVVVLAVAVPLPRPQPLTVGKLEEPLAWQQTEALLAVTEKEEVVPPASLETLREALEELRGRTPEDWYSHASLEAGETLRASVEQSLESLARDFSAADAALEKLARDGATSESTLRELAQAMQEAGAGLKNNALALDPALMDKLAQLAKTGNLRQLNPEQLAALREAMQKGVNGACAALGKDPAALLMAGNLPGAGGVQRGRGDAPLTLGDPNAPLDGTVPALLPAAANDTPAIGDLTGLRIGEHEVDRTAAVSNPSGNPASPGAGGEAVNRQPFTPAEREILQRYFK